MGFSDDNSKVRGDVFDDTGKWKYTVVLDYRGGDYDSYDLWIEAILALKRATKSKISGVIFELVPENWTLVVLEPYSKYQHPIIVKGTG